MEKRIAVYEEFGAVGDGIHDDIEAIKACHDYANANGLEVYATDGRSYYIGGRDITVTVKTSTHWGGARFIIDDRSLENIENVIFRVVGEGEVFVPEITSLVKNQKKIDFPHTGKVFVRVFNDNKRVYIRKGLNQNSGEAASDCFVVDGDGNVCCGINWDYPTVTKAYAKSADDEPIVIEGGIFTTVANQAESLYNYHWRNIVVERSNVTLRGITHLVEGEGDHGAPYRGFITAEECASFTLEDCLLTPHFIYYTQSKIPGKTVPMGTYDINIKGAIGVTIHGIKQTKDINDTAYWGLMGSNFSKDVLLENCEISRYDAHCGVTNATVRGCKFGWQGVNLIGFGEFKIEDSTVAAGAFINLRPDYGSFFEGTLSIKGCTWIPTGRNPFIIAGLNTGDHYFGYTCSMPIEIEIDGLFVDEAESTMWGPLYILPNYDPNYENGKPYAYEVPETVKIRNITAASGRDLDAAKFPEAFLDTQLIGM